MGPDPCLRLELGDASVCCATLELWQEHADTLTHLKWVPIQVQSWHANNSERLPYNQWMCSNVVLSLNIGLTLSSNSSAPLPP